MSQHIPRKSEQGKDIPEKPGSKVTTDTDVDEAKSNPPPNDDIADSTSGSSSPMKIEIIAGIFLLLAAVIGVGPFLVNLLERPPNPTTPYIEVVFPVSARSAPGVGSQVVQEFVANERVDVRGVTADGEWYLVSLPNGGEGWIANLNARIQVFGDDIPVVAFVPTETRTPTDLPRLTATNTTTPTATPTATPTQTPTSTATQTYTATATSTHTATSTETSTPTNIPTLTDTPAAVPTTVALHIPSGTYTITQDGQETQEPLEGFSIDESQVTNAQFSEYVIQASNLTQEYELIFNDDPRTIVNWHDANFYCIWRGGRLPIPEQLEVGLRSLDSQYVLEWTSTMGSRPDSYIVLEWAEGVVYTLSLDANPVIDFSTVNLGFRCVF